MDIRACENEDVNKEYATDKARFCYDGLNKKRITEPMIRDPSGNLVPYGWDEVLQSKIFKVISPNNHDHYNRSQLKNPDTSGALDTLRNQYSYNQTQCEDGARAVRIL